MRKARAAVARQDFVQAGEVYAHILEKPEMATQINIHMQYAICIEKTGQLIQSINQCEQRIHECEKTGEIEQLKSLQLKVSALKQLSQKEQQDTDIDAASHPLQAKAMNTGDAFSLDSQEIIPIETKENKPKNIEKPASKKTVVRTILAKAPRAPEPKHVKITEKSISEDRKKQKAANLFGGDKHNTLSHKISTQGLQLTDQETISSTEKAPDVWSRRE